MDILLSRMFVSSRHFDKKWTSLGLNDDDLLVLQEAICRNPQKYPVIRGTGGLRKARIAFRGKGKSGGIRVLFVDFLDNEVIGLVYVYSKNQQEEISEDDRKIFKLMIEQMRKSWRD